MKNENKRTKAEWLDMVERYFDATTTPEEEKALRAFLATDESNTADFNEIKAVIGYLSTAKAIKSGKYHKKRTYTISRRHWMGVAATIAIIATIGIAGKWTDHDTHTTDRERYIACINGKEYNDKEIALNQMHEAMAMICSTTKGNDIEKQLTSMFSLSDNK